MRPCPTCKGQRQIRTPDGSLWQICPYCDGTGEDPGRDARYMAYKSTIVLTANQVLPNQKVSIGASPFKLKMLTRLATGTFRIKLHDANRQAMVKADPGATTNDRVPDSCLFGDATLPFLLAPHPVYLENGLIGFDIEDTSGAGNTVQLVFHGTDVQWG